MGGDLLDVLSETSSILASSFRLCETLPAVAQACVREFADYCAIVTARQGTAPSIVEATRDDLVLAGAAARTGDHLRAELQARGLRTILQLPLGGREATGTLVVAAQASDAFSLPAQKLAKILALQISNAIDQAALFERTRRIADHLQRALLPESFPSIPAAVLHAAYRPASDEAEIGGDWYDAFMMPDGRVAISVGDVAGHGLDAATTMGEVRQALRAAAVGNLSPSAVLEHVNGISSLRSSISMVTAIFGYYTPHTRELTYAVAGHPPPLITIRSGVNALLPGGGLPFGVPSVIDAADWTLTLPPEAQVTFYTDGMTEYGRDVIAGESALLAAARQYDVRSAQNPAERLQEYIFAHFPNRDDAATLVLTCEDGPVPLQLRYTAMPIAAPLVRASMFRLAEELRLDDERAFDLVSAVGEAVANAVEHAYRGQTNGIITITVGVTSEEVTIVVEDQGQWKPFQRRDERGRGLALMRDLVDGVSVHSSRQKTSIALTLSRIPQSVACR